MDAPLDVSSIEYTLSTPVTLDDINIHADTHFYKLGEFDSRKFEVDSMKRLEKALLKTHFTFEWIAGRVTLGAARVAKHDQLPFVIEEAAHWSKVEAALEHWMRVKKREIAVKLVLCYRKVRPDDVDSDTDVGPAPRGKKVQNCIALE